MSIQVRESTAYLSAFDRFQEGTSGRKARKAGGVGSMGECSLSTQEALGSISNSP